MALTVMSIPRDNWPLADTVVRDHWTRPLFRTAPDSNILLYMANSHLYHNQEDFSSSIGGDSHRGRHIYHQSHCDKFPRGILLADCPHRDSRTLV